MEKNWLSPSTNIAEILFRGTIYGNRINIGSVLYQADIGVERQHKN
jgi:hypothetical protein